MALEGNLKDFAFAEMLRMVGSGEKSGTLHLEHGDASGTVCFDRGRIRQASTSGPHEALGRRLVKAGIITEQQLRQALGVQQLHKADAAGRRLGRILVDDGYLERTTLETFIHAQIDDVLFDLFRWEEGEVRFDADERCDEGDADVWVSVDDAIIEGTRRLRGWSKIRERIPSPSTSFIMATAPGFKSQDIHLRPREWMLLCHLHTTRSVAELVELTGYTEFDAAEVLYGMYGVGLIEKVEDQAAAPVVSPG